MFKRLYNFAREKREGRKFQLISPAKGNFVKVIMRGRNGNDEGYSFILGKNPTWFLFLGVGGGLKCSLYEFDISP